MHGYVHSQLPVPTPLQLLPCRRPGTVKTCIPTRFPLHLPFRPSPIATTNRPLDLPKLGVSKVSELVTRFASDLCTLVVTPSMAAVLVPLCGKKYGQHTAPARVAPAMTVAEAEQARQAKMQAAGAGQGQTSAAKQAEGISADVEAPGDLHGQGSDASLRQGQGEGEGGQEGGQGDEAGAGLGSQRSQQLEGAGEEDWVQAELQHVHPHGGDPHEAEPTDAPAQQGQGQRQQAAGLQHQSLGPVAAAGGLLPLPPRDGSSSGGGGAYRVRPDESPLKALQRVAATYLYRRILASRFRLNQEAYRTTLPGTAKPPHPSAAAAPAPTSDPAAAAAAAARHMTVHIPGVTPLLPSTRSLAPAMASVTRRNLIKEINEAAEAIGPSLGWPLDSIVPDLYRLARDMGLDEGLVAQLDALALLQRAGSAPAQNPYKLIRKQGQAEAAAAEGTKVGGAGERFVLPAEIAGTTLVPMLGPHRELQILLETWLCLHSVLPEYTPARQAALAQAATAASTGDAAAAGTDAAAAAAAAGADARYPASRVQHDYWRQWSKTLDPCMLGFECIADLMCWEVFAPLLDFVEDGAGG